METMSFVEILKLVGQGGFPVLFALLLLGLGYLVIKLGPSFLSAWNTQTNEISSLKAKVDSMQAILLAMQANDVNTAKDVAVIKADATGNHSAVSSDDADRATRRR